MSGNGYTPPNIDPRPGPDCRFVKSFAELDELDEPPELSAAAPPAERHPKRKAGNRWQTLNGFIDFTLRGLSRAEGFIWLVLFRETKPDGIATASFGWMAEQVGANRSTVSRAIRGLVKAGLLTVVRRGGLRQGPSKYRVNPFAKQAGREPK